MATNRKKNEDLWALVDNEPTENFDEVDTTTLFVGDSGCGKSTLIQSFLKPTITKEPKSTFALDYNFARKKATSSSSSGGKSVAHIWELGGDISEPKLLEVPLTVHNLSTTAVVIVCDLSKPQNVLISLLKWIKLIKNVVDMRLKELQSTNSAAATAIRELAVIRTSEHDKDSKRISPCDIPLYIVANKYDSFKSQSSADRRCLMQVTRFVAHYHSATLITASNADAPLKESFRSHMTSICFRTSPKSVCEAVLERPIFITAGKDDFEAILLACHRSIEDGDKVITSPSTTSGKSRLASSESDINTYVTATGVTRDCWTRLAEHVLSVFGASDVGDDHDKDREEEYESGSSEKKAENNFPESEVDDMRVQMDSALLRYIAAAERRAELLEKTNNPKKAEAKGEEEEEEKRSSRSGEKKKSSRKM